MNRRRRDSTVARRPKRMHAIRSVAAAAVIALTVGSPKAQPTQAIATVVTVQTQAGKLRGVNDDGIERFKGIPFAAPPVAGFRWRPPQPVVPWRDVRAADSYGNDCMQNRFPFDSAPSHQPLSEDCLYLNVWAPVHPAAHAAVLVWIHGGGLVTGSGAPQIFDGSAFARK